MHPDSSIRPTEPPPLPSEGNWYETIANYLVPNTGERIRYERLGDDGEVEKFKRAADIALIDPACGTMHFGQYAFGLFRQMYLDEIQHAGEPGWPAEPSLSDPQLIPATIIEKNLYGIDIDARAIQIASLSLLLTAKEAAASSGYSPLNVKLRKSNLVVANAVNIGEGQIRSLVTDLGERLGSRSLQEALFKTIWENLQNVGELGSLIQVRESVTRVLDEWVDRQAKAKGITRIRAPKDSEQLVLQLVVEGNCLTRTSTAGRAKLWAELRKRYLMDRRRPLYGAFWSEWRRSKSDSERGLTAYTLLALNDRLVADLGMQWLYIYLRRAPAELRVAEVLNFIRRAGETGHPEVREWTEDTQLHVAQHYMASIRDFGLARGKSKKFSQRPALYAAPVRLLVRVLRLASVKDLEILASPVFRLLAIEGAEVIDALGELNQLGELRFRMQADVVELKIGGAE